MEKKNKNKSDRSKSEIVANKRYFGTYECSHCDRIWYSGQGWLGFPQKCKWCEVWVQPKKLRPLEKPINKNQFKYHNKKLCAKCIELGRNCSKRVFYYDNQCYYLSSDSSDSE